MDNINNIYSQESINNDERFCKDLPTNPQPGIGKILITGATGYIGGRLVPELLARGYKIRIMVRSASPEHKERWPDAEIVVADASDRESLRKAMEGIHTAYYLIHSLLFGKQNLEKMEINAAYNFRKVAQEKNVKRLIYLGALGDVNSTLSTHLRSRMAVAEELKRGSVPVTILRAAIIIGSGSASYELIKDLAMKFPFLFIPYWANTECQPIGVRDVIKYLVGVLEEPKAIGQTYDIGGKDVLSYKMMLKTLADIMGKHVFFIPTPLSWIVPYAYIANICTSVPGPIIWCLLEGIKNRVVCKNDEIKKIIPFQVLSYEEAVIRAMTRDEQDNIHTRWSDAYPPAHYLALKLHELKGPPAYTASYSLFTNKSRHMLFHSICRIGGKKGWFHNNWLWRLRGILDRILMGVGTARGRRSSSTLRTNDVIDFWRVEDIKHDQRLLLRAEMKLPGKAWLEFNISDEGEMNLLNVKAFYQPNGIFGVIYWYIFLPFHYIIFEGLIRQIEKRCDDNFREILQPEQQPYQGS